MKGYVPYIILGSAGLLFLAVKAARAESGGSSEGNANAGNPGPANPGSSSATTNEKIDAFIKKYGAYAYNLQQQTNFPGILALAQAALETGWGKKIPQNNMFGIKAGSSWTGPTVNAQTFEYTPAGVQYNTSSNFRAYPNVWESFKDYYRLMTTERYRNALYHVNDPAKMIQMIVAAGYATGPNYASLVISIMRSLLRRLKILYPDASWPTV